jgi:peptidoglycan/LPS O-acetylase OafA/YrhL
MTANMPEESARPAYTIAIVGGALLWLTATLVSGKREAWDSSLYWTVAYPLSIVLAGWLGYRFPRKPWRWGLSIFLAQAVVMVFAGGSYSMLPLGLILFAVISLPAIALAYVGARFGSRKDVTLR